MQTSKATIFWPSISSYQEKDAYAHTCKNQFSHVSVIRIFILKNIKSSCIKFCQVFLGWGASCPGQGIFTPGGQAAQRQLHPRGGKLPRVGGKIPRGIFTPGGQAAQRQLHPRGASCPGCKINRYTGTALSSNSIGALFVSCRSFVF